MRVPAAEAVTHAGYPSAVLRCRLLRVEWINSACLLGREDAALGEGVARAATSGARAERCGVRPHSSLHLRAR